MSSELKAYADDEDEWGTIQKNLQITQYNWRVYSTHRTLAEQGYKEHEFTGPYLYKYVLAALELQKAALAFDNTVQKLKEAKQLLS